MGLRSFVPSLAWAKEGSALTLRGRARGEIYERALLTEPLTRNRNTSPHCVPYNNASIPFSFKMWMRRLHDESARG